MNEHTNRSLFVSVLAWIVIAKGSFFSLIALMQNLMFFLVFSQTELQQAMADNPALPAMPAASRLLFQNIHVVLLAVLALALCTVAAGVGLLKRRNWARRLLLGLLAMGMLWCLGGFVLQQLMLSQMQAEFAQFPAEGPDVGAFFWVMRAFSGVLVFGLTGLFGWLAWRLNSAEVRREFA